MFAKISTTSAKHVKTLANAAPFSPARDADAAERQALRHCRRLAKGHYENFLVGTLFLPRAIRQDFYNVYAYCRTADDLADESASASEALAKLARWRRGLLQSVGDSIPLTALPDPVFVALRSTIRRHRLPPQPFLDLLTAFEQDQSICDYSTFAELLAYCQYSANPVGRIVLRLASVDDAELDALSDEICTGLQLANFWQDVKRDRAIGRTYIPAEDLQRFGVSPSDLDAATTSRSLKRLLEFQCERAAGYLQRGLPLADQVPGWLAKDVWLFAQGGLETLRAIRRADYDVLRRRPRVTRWQQAKLLCRALSGARG